MSKSRLQTHRLTGQTVQEFDAKPFWVFDIETGKPSDASTFGGAFVCGQFRCSDNKEQAYWVYDEKEALDFMLSRKCRGMKIYAHNGSGYDYKYLIRYINQHKDDFPGLECKFLPRKDGRVICMTMTRHKHTVRLLDTFHVFPKSLKEFTSVFAPEYVKKDREWQKSDGTPNWFDPDNPMDREYLDYDCLGLIEALTKFKELIHRYFGVNIAMTAAGTAMKAWRVTIPHNKAYWRPREDVETFIRESYAGGYVFLTNSEPLYDRVHIDINAAYAASMRLGVPCGVAAYTQRYEQGYPGFYKCKVTVPQGERYPIVPHKTASGIEWATGTFTAIVPSCTIEYAKTLGVQFEIEYGYVFERIEYPFQKFLGIAENLELTYEKSPLKECAKLLRNSLYGRFGMNPVAERIVYAEQPPDDLEPLTDKQTAEVIDDFYLERELLSVASMQIHWASWITAQTRIRVHQIARAGKASYGDTDSADVSRQMFDSLVQRGIIEVGKAYGQVKIEHEFEWFVSHAPKDYIGYLSDMEWQEHQKKCLTCSPEHRYIHRAKAMPRGKIISREHIDAPLHNVQVEYQSMISFQTQIKHPDMPLAITRLRSYSTLNHSISWVQGANGQVYPKHLTAT